MHAGKHKTASVLFMDVNCELYPLQVSHTPFKGRFSWYRYHRYGLEGADLLENIWKIIGEKMCEKKKYLF